MTIRAAIRSDAVALVALRRAIVAEGPGANAPLALDEFDVTIDDQRDSIEAFAKSARSTLLVAIADGALVGELTVKPISDRRALHHVGVLGMSVARESRRRGIGRALLTQAIAWAPPAGITRIELYVYARNAAAIALYEQLGFALEGRRRRVIREGDAYVDDLVMARLW